MKNLTTLLCTVALGLGLTAGLHAQTTAFTYQGRLNQGGVPARGNYDMQFSLFNVAAGGVALAGPNSATVNVTDGHFTVPLNFGSAAYTGDNLWLHIAVRTNGVGSYSNLAPRQPLTSAPYAIMSAGANNVSANGVSAAAVQNGAISLGKLAPGVLNPVNFPANSVTSVQLADDLDLGSAAAIGQLDVFRTSVGTPAISLFGGSSQISTFGSDGQEQIRLWGPSYGEMLLLNNLPSNDRAVFLSANGSGGGVLALGSSNGLDRAVLSGDNAGGVLNLLDGLNSLTLRLNSAGDSYLNGGNLGLGIASPAARLDVNGDAFIRNSLVVDASNLNIGNFGPGLIFGPGSGESIASKRDVGGNQWGLDFFTGFVPRMSIANNGNVGIGTYPATRLDVMDGVNQNGTIHVGGYGANGDPKLIRFGDGDYVHVGEIDSDDRLDLKGTIISMTTAAVGIGTATPVQKLHVSGAFARIDGAGDEQAYIGGDGFGGDVQVGSFNPAVNNVALYNATSGQYMNLYAKSITITGGADLAEPFEMSEEKIPQGAVVIIDEENPGQLKMSTEAYDTHVAGIVSGAGGINPGLMLKQEGMLDQGQNVALTGRVYALADATAGPIKPGDLLTTSATPGHCMKAGDRDRAQGAILGKAMTGLKDGKGKVLVLVTLQ